jgi:hypothetical protein
VAQSDRVDICNFDNIITTPIIPSTVSQYNINLHPHPHQHHHRYLPTINQGTANQRPNKHQRPPTTYNLQPTTNNQQPTTDSLPPTSTSHHRDTSTLLPTPIAQEQQQQQQQQ